MAREYVLWGRHVAYGPLWLKIMGGSLAECRREMKYRMGARKYEGKPRWECSIENPGKHPEDK